jgi:voltage-gated potassium channel
VPAANILRRRRLRLAPRFSIVTVTTVGYGDTFPTFPGGRIVAAGLMVLGIGFLGLATAAIASHFVNAEADEKHAESTDKQELILAELRRIGERLDRLESR